MENPQDGIPGQAITGVVLPDGPPVHYSTGRLTRAQAGTVNAWRARLRPDRQLPGRVPARPGTGMTGAGGRVRASCSDVVAAAVADLLRRPPGPLELARYAYRAMAAASAAAHGGEAGESAPLYPPVSWYLPGWLAARAEQLRASAWAAVRHAREDALAEAARLYPGGGRDVSPARSLHVLGTLDRAGLTFSRQVPRGAIARMAIDRWAQRHPDDVAAEAAGYAASVHQQPHRARSDMRVLAR